MLREPGRAVTKFACNRLEGEQPQDLPQYLTHEAGAYRLRNELLRQWEGPRPRLTCLTDAGDSKPQFFRQVLPIGSGTTEAACKTVFTQRLQHSGMRWSGPEARTTLNLRVLLLSGLWDNRYAAAVQAYQRTHIRTPHQSPHPQPHTAA